MTSQHHSKDPSCQQFSQHLGNPNASAKTHHGWRRLIARLELALAIAGDTSPEATARRLLDGEVML